MRYRVSRAEASENSGTRLLGVGQLWTVLGNSPMSISVLQDIGFVVSSHSSSPMGYFVVLLASLRKQGSNATDHTELFSDKV